MNLNTFKISVTPCVVCNYAFSDRHHIWPQAKGGKSLITMCLCPNHHRFANIVQVMVLQSISDAEINAFAEQYFDAAFNATMLRYLIETQQQLGIGVSALYTYGEAMERYADTLERHAADLEAELRTGNYGTESVWSIPDAIRPIPDPSIEIVRQHRAE